MSAVFQLLRKDWMRIRREPGGFLIQIALPLVIRADEEIVEITLSDGPVVTSVLEQEMSQG